jgi:HAD superfamily hydrolase (TIGR01509 family)
MLVAVIFDVDGTLLDSVDFHARAWQETFAENGIHATFDQVRSQIGKGSDQLMPVFLPPDRLKNEGERIKEERNERFKKEYLPRVRPFPKVRELIQRLIRDRRKVVLASSGNRSEVDEYKRIAGIDDLIESDTSSDDADRSKPHPDIFIAALEKLGNPDPATVLVVGDTPYDAEAAGKAGLRTLGVLCGGFPAADLRQAGCIALYRDPADLLEQYEQSPLSTAQR